MIFYFVTSLFMNLIKTMAAQELSDDQQRSHSYDKLMQIYEGRDETYWRNNPLNARDILGKLIKYIETKYKGFTNLDFVKTYLGYPWVIIPDITWEQFSRACMMCIFEKETFEISEFDPTKHLYPGAITKTETENLRIWNILNDYIRQNIFSERVVGLILFRLMIVKNSFRPGLASQARQYRTIHDIGVDPIIINLFQNSDQILPTNIVEFNIFINSKDIEFNYSKLYLKLCIEHIAKQKMSIIIRLITSNPDYKLARKRIMDVYHS